MARPQDEEGELMILDEDEANRFMSARNGDNLVTPFQCDHCHFVNIMKREPLGDLAADVRESSSAFAGLTLMHSGPGSLGP